MFITTKMRPHAVCVPWPAQGHIHAMLKLAKVLHLKGFHITFVHTEFNYNRIVAAGGPSALEGVDNFRFEAIPDGLPPSDPTVNQDISSLGYAVRNNLHAPFRDLLKRLNASTSEVAPVTCVVSDSFTSFTIDVTEEMKIPTVFFSSVNASGYMGCFLFQELLERGLIPLKSESDLSNGYLDTPLDWIPGMKNMRLKDIPSFIRTTDVNDFLFNSAKYEAQQALRPSAIIINTFDDLETSVLDAMSSFFPPIYTIGPLTLLTPQIRDKSLNDIGSNNLWTEESKCLKWLEERSPGSVIYVNFGSLAIMTSQQLLEFAWGLANSGHVFLWVIRADVLQGESTILSKEFLDETCKRGLIISWCHQEEVLKHPSIGGFLTHCGWNSMIESISAGVPMICWPYFGDQQTNCRNACTEWEIGLEIDNNVCRNEVTNLVRELIGGEKGKEMKRKALEWKESALRATLPCGNSSMNLDKVIKDVLLKKE